MVYTIGDKMDESMKVQNTFYYVLKPFCSFISIVKFVMPFHQFPSSVGWLKNRVLCFCLLLLELGRVLITCGPIASHCPGFNNNHLMSTVPLSTSAHLRIHCMLICQCLHSTIDPQPIFASSILEFTRTYVCMTNMDLYNVWLEWMWSFGLFTKFLR
jgi:hypothetical protein